MAVSSGFNPGDCILDYVTIGAGKKLGTGTKTDISSIVLELAVYESIHKPYVSIEITIIDAGDMLNNMIGLDGTNPFSISFHQPGQKPYVWSGRIFAVEKNMSMDSMRTVTYKMTGYPTYMANLIRIQQSFKDQPATSVAQNIAGQMGIPAQIKAPSKGVAGNSRVPFQINGVQGFKAVKQALLHAASSVDNSSVYVFYANQYGVYIDTLEHLENTMTSVAMFFQRPMGAHWKNDVASQNMIILTYKEERRIDATQQIQSGAQQTRTYDFFSMSFNAGQTTSDGSSGGGKASTYHNIPYDSMGPPNFTKDIAAPRKRAASLFDSQALTVHVMLHTEVSVGLGFTAKILAPTTTNPPQPVLASISGLLLCTEVCHRVDFTKARPQGTSTIRGVKGTNLEMA